MVVSVISFWLPLMWALVVTLFWRAKIKEPVNDWWVCALVFALNFFFFAYLSILFLVFMVVKLFMKKEQDVTK
jgi:pilus assembly protein TadC